MVQQGRFCIDALPAYQKKTLQLNQCRCRAHTGMIKAIETV